MNPIAELVTVLMTLWIIFVLYTSYLFGRLTFSTSNYKIVKYKFHKYIVTYIIAFPLFIITMALLKAIRE